MGISFGFFLGISMPSLNTTKVFLSHDLLQASYHVILPFLFCYLFFLQILLPSNLGDSFDVPITDIEKFLADINSSKAVKDQSSGTESLEYLGSMRLPKVILCIFKFDIQGHSIFYYQH